ncbi:MAG TPA: methylated-DNA--[protein]-cysteine S-methyltransferase [Candidatus Saccharimonadales bacterium]|nr:methylated-DNA--[protein]-cysteine S-methyltransferase [Candidatus Saccharimonadales bacterium]
MVEISFSKKIYELVAKIPAGRLMTYGQVAALCGNPRAARQVGQVAHFGPVDLPWHRVVNREGKLASGWPGGIHIHRQLLEQENVVINDEYKANIKELLWWPE